MEPVLTRHVREPNGYTLDFYMTQGGGYGALKKALGMTPGVTGMPSGIATSAGPGADPTQTAGGPSPTPGWANHAEARAARRAARAARRAERGNSAGIVFGIILILVGGWFLVRAAIPELDDRWLGPGVLVALGVLLLVMAAARDPLLAGRAADQAGIVAVVYDAFARSFRYVVWWVLGIALGLAGIRVTYVPEARVFGEMPVTGSAAARTQDAAGGDGYRSEQAGSG